MGKVTKEGTEVRPEKEEKETKVLKGVKVLLATVAKRLEGGKVKGEGGGMLGHAVAKCESLNGTCHACGQWGHRSADCPNGGTRPVNEVEKEATPTPSPVQAIVVKEAGVVGSLSTHMTLGETPLFTN